MSWCGGCQERGTCCVFNGWFYSLCSGERQRGVVFITWISTIREKGRDEFFGGYFEPMEVEQLRVLPSLVPIELTLMIHFIGHQ